MWTLIMSCYFWWTVKAWVNKNFILHHPLPFIPTLKKFGYFTWILSTSAIFWPALQRISKEKNNFWQHAVSNEENGGDIVGSSLKSLKNIKGVVYVSNILKWAAAYLTCWSQNFPLLVSKYLLLKLMMPSISNEIMKYSGNM